MNKKSVIAICLFAAFLVNTSVYSQNFNYPAANQKAMTLAGQSPLIVSNYQMILTQLNKIKAPKLRQTTIDAVSNPNTCIAHRAGLSVQDKHNIIEELKRQNLVDTAYEVNFKGGLIQGIFPPLRNDGTACPQLLQSFQGSPGSIFGDHHSYPGGLIMHESFVMLAAIGLGNEYKKIYVSTGTDGLPVFKSIGDEAGLIDNDLFLAAPIWHDWAKTFVSQWNDDGTEFPELNFGGNGRTDNYGKPGFSIEQGHHILGIAEMMSRKIDNEIIIAVASCHSVPTYSEEYKIINWLRTAAIISRIDLLKTGLVYTDSTHKLRLAPYRSPSNINYTGHKTTHTQMKVEYSLTQLADGDWTFTNPAAKEIDYLLELLAPEFGYSKTDKEKYNWNYRNTVLCYFSAERLSLIYGNRGIEGVRNEIQKLRKLSKI